MRIYYIQVDRKFCSKKKKTVLNNIFYLFTDQCMEEFLWCINQTMNVSNIDRNANIDLKFMNE